MIIIIKFGHFENEYKVWVIHKADIRTWIESEVKAKGIGTCPVFSFDTIDAAIDKLPDRIHVQTSAVFDYVYDRPFIGADIPQYPTGIRHVYEVPPSAQVQESISIRLN